MSVRVTRLNCCGPKRADSFTVETGRSFATKTGFVKHHPFKPGWEIRRCFSCATQWAVDSRQLTN
mgnify:CR=1 FL=1|jgi:hypothetical protein